MEEVGRGFPHMHQSWPIQIQCCSCYSPLISGVLDPDLPTVFYIRRSDVHFNNRDVLLLSPIQSNVFASDRYETLNVLWRFAVLERRSAELLFARGLIKQPFMVTTRFHSRMVFLIQVASTDGRNFALPLIRSQDVGQN